MGESKKTLVIGASEKPERYSNMAIRKLLQYGYEVLAIGNRQGRIGETEFSKEKKTLIGVHTITLYIGPQHQPEYYDYILSLLPKRIIFNPGTENETFMQSAKEKGILCMEACTLVMLSTGQY